MSTTETSREHPPDSVGVWTAWFAWLPVRLYMSPHFAWLRTIHRRNVRLHGIESCDYSDTPEEYPSPPREP